VGNGPGLKGYPGKTVSIDIETSPLTQDMIESAANKALSNFGLNPIIFMPMNVMGVFGWEAHPEFSKTPWANRDRLTKRENKTAYLHVFLKKLDVLKKLSDDEIDEVVKTSVKRLKKAKWAKNAGNKVQSSP
jgi:hypothetical protein